VHIGFNEKPLQALARAHGAIWDRTSRLWRLPLAAAREAGLADRITENWPEMDSNFGKNCRLVAVSGHLWKGRLRPITR
jgi:hypothetical protein